MWLFGSGISLYSASFSIGATASSKLISTNASEPSYNLHYGLRIFTAAVHWMLRRKRLVRRGRQRDRRRNRGTGRVEARGIGQLDLGVPRPHQLLQQRLPAAFQGRRL